MKPIDIIAVLIGAIALFSLLRDDAAPTQITNEAELSAAVLDNAPPSDPRDRELRALCTARLLLTLNKLMALVDAVRGEGESRSDAMARIKHDPNAFVTQLREAQTQKKVVDFSVSSEALDKAIRGRTCPEIDAEGQRTLTKELIRYDPELLEAAKRFYPGTFEGVDPL